MRSFLGVGVVVGALLVANVAHALTDKLVFKCEDKAAAAFNKWGGARGKCLTKCQLKKIKEGASSTLSCSPPLDAATLTCTGAADAKYTAAVASACPAASFPACGSYTGENAASYAANQLAAQTALIDGSTVPLLMCSDADAKCEAKTVGVLAKLSAAIGKCLGKCYAASQVKGDATKQCTPQGTAPYFDVLDGTSKACIDAAVAKATAGVNKACPVLPGCSLYTFGVDFVVNNLVVANLAGSYSDLANGPYCTLP